MGAGCLALTACGGSAAPRHRTLRPRPPVPVAPAATTSDLTATTTTTPRPAIAGAPFPVLERVLVFTDRSRSVRYRDEAPQPRRLVTIVRYPRAGGPFPLIVFGHGFAVTPAIYSGLLGHWARAGYVVAAPIFPLGNANAPGGPNESDLINQPSDMSFVITRLLAASRDGAGLRRGLIDPRHIAVSGQSDGGDTALSVAYDEHWQDRRIGAVVILSGQEVPGLGGYTFPSPAPPLLATQGLADTINLPSTTYAFFDAAPRPKYLLTMPGAPHLGPYTDQQPQLGVVERVTTAFLDRYLKGQVAARRRLVVSGDRQGVAELRAG